MRRAREENALSRAINGEIHFDRGDRVFIMELVDFSATRRVHDG